MDLNGLSIPIQRLEVAQQWEQAVALWASSWRRCQEGVLDGGTGLEEEVIEVDWVVDGFLFWCSCWWRVLAPATTSRSFMSC